MGLWDVGRGSNCLTSHFSLLTSKPGPVINCTHTWRRRLTY